MRTIPLLIAASILCACTATIYENQVTDYVDPLIGSEGPGNVFIGPSCPYGMVKPGPDCKGKVNSGWRPAPFPVEGFSQVHVSGTGGGPKYGNILIQPYLGDATESHSAMRKWEKSELGYYATEFEDGIITEISTSERASSYRITYPSEGSLVVDLGWCLWPEPGEREAQRFEDSFLRIDGTNEISGYQTISGGWNKGRAFTTYFCLISDKDFDSTSVACKDQKYRADVSFGSREANIVIGISYMSEAKARENALRIRGKALEELRQECIGKWQDLLSRVQVPVNTPEKHKRMLYTGIYHATLMPVDRTGEWAPASGKVYYDDFYALWDTYRTSHPLITIIDEQRQVDIVNALLNIYQIDGFLPDARSGNCNGRTQGGSNAEIVIADAFVKGLKGIDYDLALEAMIHDAEVAPENEEKEGRGGLEGYNTLGYVPWGYARSGNRTLEYSVCDYAIHTVAKGLGRDDIADKYLERSNNWKNLWNDNIENGGEKGFIMPRNKDGNWMERITLNKKGNVVIPKDLKEEMMTWPAQVPWWTGFFYEGNDWTYSLFVPHDIKGLIEKCGGREVFLRRLDKYFDNGYYSVGNEPSFLTPCLYHWAGMPEKTSERTLAIIEKSFDDTHKGLPGNDDSGAMSAWMVWHMMGLYPIAGQDIYVVHRPVLPKVRIHLSNGRTLTIKAVSGCRTTFINHKDIIRGGTLRIPE